MIHDRRELCRHHDHVRDARVLDLESGPVRLGAVLVPTRGLVEEHQRLHPGGALLLDALLHGFERLARVQHVVDDEHRPALQLLGQLPLDLHALAGLEFDAATLGWVEHDAEDVVQVLGQGPGDGFPARQ